MLTGIVEREHIIDGRHLFATTCEEDFKTIIGGAARVVGEAFVNLAYEPVKFGGLQEEWLLVYLVNMLYGQRLYVSSGPASKSVECRRAAKSATDI